MFSPCSLHVVKRVVEHVVVSVRVVEQHVVDPLSGVVDLAVAPVGQSPKLSERDRRIVGG